MTSLDEFILRSESHPHEFHLCAHYWTHESSQISIWVANGFFFYGFNKRLPMSFFDKMKVKPALKKWSARYVAHILNEVKLDGVNYE